MKRNKLNSIPFQGTMNSLSSIPLAYLFSTVHSGFIQILSHFTCVAESVLHSYPTESLEEHDCHKCSRRGCESDPQIQSATTIPYNRNPQERASCYLIITAKARTVPSL